MGTGTGGAAVAALNDLDNVGDFVTDDDAASRAAEPRVDDDNVAARAVAEKKAVFIDENETARERMSRRLDEERAAESSATGEPSFAELIGDEADAAFDDDGFALDGDAAVVLDRDEPAIDAAPAKTRTIVVNGQRVQKTDAEILELAQRALETGSKADRLDDLLTRASRTFEQSVAPAADAAATAAAAAATESQNRTVVADLGIEDARFNQVIREIQTGDEADAGAAFRDLVRDVAAGIVRAGGEQGDAAERAVQMIERRREDIDARDMLARYVQTEFPAVAASEKVRRTFFEDIAAVQLGELKAMGMPDAELAKVQQMGVGAVRYNHSEYRRRRNGDGTPIYPGLSDDQAILRKAGARTAKGYKEIGAQLDYRPAQRQSAATSDARRDRKDRIETHQARPTAGARPPAEGRRQAQAKSEMDSRREGLEQRRTLNKPLTLQRH